MSGDKEYIESLLRIDRKERFLDKVVVWLKTKKLWNECVTDIGEEQLVTKEK